MPEGRGRGRWGWYRLTADAAARLVADAGVRPGDLVLDVGAGTGTITRELVAVGARVVAVELHPRRVQTLRERVAGMPVVVVAADAADLWLPRRPFRVVANPPFSVTTPLLRRLLAPGSRLVRADLVLARRAAIRIVQGRVSGASRWARTFDTRLVHAAPRSWFVPRPPVDVVVLRIARR